MTLWALPVAMFARRFQLPSLDRFPMKLGSLPRFLAVDVHQTVIAASHRYRGMPQQERHRVNQFFESASSDFRMSPPNTDSSSVA